jgi:hypothetical protein
VGGGMAGGTIHVRRLAHAARRPEMTARALRTLGTCAVGHASGHGPRRCCAEPHRHASLAHAPAGNATLTRFLPVRAALGARDPIGTTWTRRGILVHGVTSPKSSS